MEHERPAPSGEPPQVTAEVATRVKALRRQLRLSAREVAERCAAAGAPSLTRSTIAKIESGVRQSVTVDELAALAQALGVPAHDLLPSTTATVGQAVSFGEMLSQMRTKALLTYEDLAKAANVAARTISDLEQGVHLTPQTKTVLQLADALGLAGPARDEFVRAAHGRPPGSVTTRTLPRDIASFTGRGSELRHLVDAAERLGDVAGICVIEGMAGVGKTALAVRLGHHVANRFPDGQLFLDLRGYTPGFDPLSAGDALSYLLRSLGVTSELVPHDTEERAAFFRSRLAGTRTLIILDNAASAAQVRPLLPGTAGCLVIVTSRRSFWGLDDAYTVGLDVLSRSEAIELFRRIAGPDRVAADDPALAAIVALCGHLPLAVRIIAARLAHRRALRVEDLVEQLRKEHNRLEYVQDEDRNMTAVFAMSYSNLPGREQDMFRHLGLIPGPDFDAFAAANLTGTDLHETKRLLDSLVDHNLLNEHVAGRYRFHDLVRAYARTLGSMPVTGSGLPAGDTEALDRLMDYYAYTAQSADRRIERRMPRADEVGVVPSPPLAAPHLDTSERAQAWISTELANLDAATRYAAGHRRPGHAIALSAALAQYLRVHGPWAQALALHEVALDAARGTGDRGGQAAALADLGSMQRTTGAIGQAEESLSQALDLYDELGDHHGQARTFAELGVVRRLTGNYEGLMTASLGRCTSTTSLAIVTAVPESWLN